ncbi:TAT-variant-translocated molybdopterin oxidoreductase [Aureibacter tunicatorum]|uniref:Molybdopterin-containing oxidoreductase family iron-sulfur binding subunit n=1 Tax=Aureibacter tunicatorum TaxID=866807 RepID=A0AAE3XN73_9BACT|nr:TAT-variant-translocated molybdopterin oxidoreductase [Aureibacter tunicatorum]MDR6238979.1 molybdopterin-containing oxidoreductase family iron-sulfur binding subunit [Aureibacter tunicatorum]BDD05095.1 quinol:cytochrome C oxidoreductase [Aureibacter tunicatorum]
MKDNQKKYWKGLEELSNDTDFVKNAENEFPEYLPINENKQNGEAEGGASRRDFLKLMGFGISAATLAACEAPVRKAIPYLNKPVEVDPGVPNFYATTYMNGGDYCSVVVKTREGRPIKIEGNSQSPISKGGGSAQSEASVLSLYDEQRYKKPLAGGKSTTWEKLDADVIKELDAIAANGGQITIVSKTVLSPSANKAIAKFTEKYPTTSHVVYDPISLNALPIANERSFGSAIIPSYDFSKADVIASFDADFMNNWVSPVEFTHQYAKTRRIYDNGGKMSRHYHFEANMSLTGSNADYRSPIKASQIGDAVAQLYNYLAKAANLPAVPASKNKIPNLAKCANDLWNAKGRSLVVSGVNDPNVQVLVNAINNILENYGKTIDLNRPVNYRQGDDKAFAQFVKDLNGGKVQGVIFFDCNPVYDTAQGASIAGGIKKAKLSVSTTDRKDETSVLSKYVAINRHYLEQWNDAEPAQGSYSLVQPTITPIFDSRQAEESFLVWAGDKNANYYEFLRSEWKANQFAKQTAELDFDRFWDSSLYSGVFVTEVEPVEYVFNADVASAGSAVSKNAKGSGFELVIYSKFAIADGAQANNPWLQELPDAITKVTWDNYITVSQADAKELGFAIKEENTSTANVTINGKSIKVPVIIQPGQAKGTIGLAVGYGRTQGGLVADGVGINAFPYIATLDGLQNRYITKGVSVANANETFKIARTQTHQTVMGRTNVVQEATFGEYKKNPAAGRETIHVTGMEGEMKASSVSIWKGHKYENHHWGLAIDLNACNGCGSCIVSCNAENNIPVVGKQEVINRREMHWLRIDRYYSSDAEAGDYAALEIASRNPEVTYMPMMCQQCNNAPCETVCPVAATTHSTEGLNQMTYNRCIGTRYCANNCPYKVRRFNWFKYFENNDQFAKNTSMNNNLGKMVLNPDVTVRSRGVMEKCSFCVQRIQAGKLAAKKEGREVQDSDVSVACAASCTSGALVFGDMNNSESKISKLLKITKNDKGQVQTGEPRAYAALEEINVSPNVYYMTKIRNKDKKTKA